MASRSVCPSSICGRHPTHCHDCVMGAEAYVALVGRSRGSCGLRYGRDGLHHQTRHRVDYGPDLERLAIPSEGRHGRKWCYTGRESNKARENEGDVLRRLVFRVTLLAGLEFRSFHHSTPFRVPRW